MSSKNIYYFDRFIEKVNGTLNKMPPVLSIPIGLCIYVPIAAVGTATFLGALCGAFLLSPCIFWCCCHSMCEESGHGVPPKESFLHSIGRWLKNDIKWCFCMKKKN